MACRPTTNSTSVKKFAKTDIVGDQQVYTRQCQRLIEGRELVRVETNTGTERRLEEALFRRGRRPPFQRTQEGCENGRIIGPVTPDRVPRIVVDEARADFRIPNDAELLALGVIVDTGQVHHRQRPTAFKRIDILDEPSPRPDFNDIARLLNNLWHSVGQKPPRRGRPRSFDTRISGNVICCARFNYLKIGG